MNIHIGVILDTKNVIQIYFKLAKHVNLLAKHVSLIPA